MCQGIPRQVLEVRDDLLRVAVDDRMHWVKGGTHLPAVQAGDFVIVYAGVATEQVSRDEAEEQLRFLRDLEELFPADGPA